jgi:hypothetical protein
LETNNENNNEVVEQNNEAVIEDPKAVLSALERAKSDAKKYREQAEQLENDLNIKSNLVNEYSNKLLKEKVVQRIAEEGIKNPERILKYINLDSLSLDDEFGVIGFEDQVSSLRQELPEVFDAKIRVGGQADTAITTSVNTQYSATEMQAMKILGKI